MNLCVKFVVLDRLYLLKNFLEVIRKINSNEYSSLEEK